MKVKKGDAKELLNNLLKQVKEGEKLLGNGKSPYKERHDKTISLETVSVPGSGSSIKTVPVVGTTSGDIGTPKSNKPKKVGHSEGTPLAERMNPHAVVHLVDVQGPSIESISGM